MVDVKNFFQEVDSHPGIRNFKRCNTELSTFWIINSDPKVQDDMTITKTTITSSAICR